MRFIALYTFFCFLFSVDVLAQNQSKPTAPTDSIRTTVDTIKLPLAPSQGFNEVVNYTARDSMIYDITNEKVYLYGNAKIEQAKVSLNAAIIEMDNTTKLVKARPSTDSLGKQVGIPKFTDGERQFESDEIVYNFDTKKGKLSQLVTKEGEGYLVGEQVKKNELNEMFIRGASYTTCNLEHPHYKIGISKVKVIPDKLIVSGPAQLIIEDVPTPLVLPFGIFPVQKTRASGVLLPNYGYSPQRGYFFQGLGYYLGISDYFDVALTSDIYTNGTWGLHLDPTYRKRYKYNGRLSLNFMNERQGDYIDTRFTVAKQFNVRWNHAQDSKARPNSNFSADVNFGTADYNRNYLVTNTNVLTNTLTSGISYNRRIPYSLFTYNLQARHEQNTNTGNVSITLPTFNLTMTRLNPFKRKIQIGSQKWYEKIGMTYSLDAQARASLPDTLFFTRKLLDTLQYGIKHRINLNSDFKLLKYFTLTPNFSAESAWYLKTVRKQWDTLYVNRTTASGEEITDTISKETIQYVNGAKQALKYSGGFSINTKLYGRVNFKKGNLRTIRHEVIPNIGMSFAPDFGTEKWGYYRYYARPVVLKDTLQRYDQQWYSIFDNSVYGGPGRGAQAALTFGINNFIQAKVFGKKDTTGEGRKISVLDRLSINSSYNFLADSVRFAPITVGGGAALFNKKINLTFGGNFDLYDMDDSGRRINTYYNSSQGQLLRFSSFNLTVPLSFSADDFNKNKTPNKQTPTGSRTGALGNDAEREEVQNNPNNYVNFNIPWRFAVDYTLRLDASRRLGRDTLVVVQTLNMNGEVNLTPRWRVGLSTGYDFANKELSRTTIDIYRDLHCWEMSFNIVPIGRYQSYSFMLRVKSTLLQDLKLQRRRSWLDVD
ncbi:MAG: LPS-assembly protein LptD [Sphingobacteriales bacterium]|nr:LPS-assembly protein LptD [Sphingobacteriales bacterium]